MVKSIAVTALKDGYSIFGNKGCVWSNAAHIYKSSTGILCGTPALSTNWARIEKMPEVGCPKCIAIYLKEQDAPVLPERKRWMGSGIYMTEQPWTQDPQLGDYVFDSDLGELIWDGTKWVNEQGK